MAVALIVEPGVAAPVGTAAPKALGDPVPLYDQLVGIVPLNIVDALSKGDMLTLIFVAILVGVGTVLTGQTGKPFAALMQPLSALLLKCDGLLVEEHPHAVYARTPKSVPSHGTASSFSPCCHALTPPHA